MRRSHRSSSCTAEREQLTPLKLLITRIQIEAIVEQVDLDTSILYVIEAISLQGTLLRGKDKREKMANTYRTNSIPLNEREIKRQEQICIDAT